MHIRKHGNKYEATVCVGYDPTTQKSIYRYTSGKTEAEARRKARKLEADAIGRPVTDTSGTRKTLGEVLDAYLEAGRVLRDWSPSTTREQTRIANNVIVPRIGHLRLRQVTTATIDRLYLDLLASGGTNGRKLSAGTVRRVHAVIRAALDLAKKRGWISHNPAVDADPPKTGRSTVQAPTLDQVKLLLKVAAETESPNGYLFTVAAIASGCRRSELVGLRWSDIDLDAGQVSITGGVVIGPDGPERRDKPKSARGLRNVHIDRLVMELLKERYETSESQWLFPGRDPARPWRPDSASRMVKRYLRRAGIPETIRLHSLRHLASSALQSAGIPTSEAAAILGHSPAVASSTYTHPLHAEHQQKAAGILGDLLRGD